MNFAIFFPRDNLAKSFLFCDRLPKFAIFLCNWLTGILVFLEVVVLQNYFFLQSFVKIRDIFPCRLTKFTIYFHDLLTKCVFFCNCCSNSAIFCGRLANFFHPQDPIDEFPRFFSRLFEEFHYFFSKRPFDEFFDFFPYNHLKNFAIFFTEFIWKNSLFLTLFLNFEKKKILQVFYWISLCFPLRLFWQISLFFFLWPIVEICDIFCDWLTKFVIFFP